MKTYEETFERVMAERDSYMRRKKERTKFITTGSVALAGIALAVISAFGLRDRLQPSAYDAQSEAAFESGYSDYDEYTAPDLLTQEIATIYTPEGYTAVSEETVEAGETKSVQAAQITAESGTTFAAATKAETATSKHGETKPATSKTIVEETALCSVYKYHINNGKYKNYIAGKVIEKEKVGEKIGSVTVTGGWQGTGTATTKETLSADVYYIKGVSDDVAVCLKFNDKGDALTTDHYYVMINTHADYSAVSDYFIGPGSGQTDTDKNVPTASNPYYEEISKEQEKTRNKNEFVTERTSAAHTIPE